MRFGYSCATAKYQIEFVLFFNVIIHPFSLAGIQRPILIVSEACMHLGRCEFFFVHCSTSVSFFDHDFHSFFLNDAKRAGAFKQLDPNKNFIQTSPPSVVMILLLRKDERRNTKCLRKFA